MDRLEIEQRAEPEDRMMLSCSSAATSFAYAQRRGWITQAEYDAAKERYGRLWNYCGD